MASLPLTAEAAFLAAVTPRSSPASVSRAARRNASPAGVSATPRLLRFKQLGADGRLKLPDLGAEHLLGDVEGPGARLR